MIDIKQAEQQLQLIHNSKDTRNYICLLILNKKLKRSDEKHSMSYYLKYNEFIEKLKQFNNTNLDFYISVNTFFVKKRREANIATFNNFFVDIDCHNKEFSDHELNSVIWHLEQDYFNKTIPTPNLIIFTGRGLQLYFRIKSMPFSKITLKYYKDVQNKIIGELKDFELFDFKVDTQAIDTSRVLRISGTINSANNKQAKILFSNAEASNISDIRYCYFPAKSYEDYKKHLEAKSKSKINIDYANREQSLLKNRLEDIINLITIRATNNIIFEGCREQILYICRNILTQLYQNEEEVKIKLLHINSQFTDPLSEKEVLNSTKTNKIYKFTNRKIVELLNITDDESKELITLQTEKIRLQKYKKSRPNNKKKKHSKKDKNIEKAKKLLAQGVTQKKVAKKLKLDTRTIRRYQDQTNQNKLSNKDKIIQCRKDGFSQQETAQKVDCSIRTVRTYWNIEKN